MPALLNQLALLLLTLTIGMACQPEGKEYQPPAPETDETTNSDEPGDSAQEDDQTPAEEEEDRPPCEFPATLTENPETIDGFVAFINELPPPVTVSCVLQALKRPLLLNATSNRFSAQGAVDSEAPRIFIKMGSLILTTVAKGEGSSSIEMSESINSTMSVKGDLKFPFTEDIPEQAPYKNIYAGGSASCAGLCHTDYQEIKKYPDGAVKYASTIIAPKPSLNVPLVELQMLRSACEGVEQQLCDFYRDLMDHGDVQAFTFP